MADLRLASSGPSVGAKAARDEVLTARQIAFVDACAAGKTLKEGATDAGVSYRTAKRWHKQETIAAAIHARLTENLSQARAVLASGSARAARALVNMADGTQEAEAARVSAARAVVEGASLLVETEEQEHRLTELEARLGRS